MTNTPAAVGEAASVATEDDGALVSKLFGSVGKVWRADERMFDAVTGLSGSGPAYIFLAIEAFADGGVAAGLPRELALGLASQTVICRVALHPLFHHSHIHQNKVYDIALCALT